MQKTIGEQMNGGAPGAPGTGKAGLTNRSSEALGRLLRFDSRRLHGPSRQGRFIALALLVLLFLGWGVWELVVA